MRVVTVDVSPEDAAWGMFCEEGWGDVDADARTVTFDNADPNEARLTGFCSRAGIPYTVRQVGRPAAAEPRDRRLHLRLSASERRALAAAAAAEGLALGDYIRSAALDRALSNTPSEDPP